MHVAPPAYTTPDTGVRVTYSDLVTITTIHNRMQRTMNNTPVLENQCQHFGTTQPVSETVCQHLQLDRVARLVVVVATAHTIGLLDRHSGVAMENHLTDSHPRAHPKRVIARVVLQFQSQ